MTFRSFSQTYQEFKVCRNGKFGLSSRIKRRFGSFCAHYILGMSFFVAQCNEPILLYKDEGKGRGGTPQVKVCCMEVFIKTSRLSAADCPNFRPKTIKKSLLRVIKPDQTPPKKT